MKMNVICAVIFVLCCFSAGLTSDSSDKDSCFNVGDYFWKHLGSKTPYRYLVNRNDSEISYGECRAKKLWALIRHGTRYPGAKLINQMRGRLIEIQDIIRENSQKGRVKLCPESIANISSWKPHMEVVNGKRLTHEGEDEMIELAERFLSRFPDILGIEYNNSNFHFRSTATQRTIQSKYYFLVGLFGRRIAHHVWSPEPVYKDPLLRFYKLCSKWLKEVHDSPKSLVEVESFKTLNSTVEILLNISNRLGMEKILSFEDVETMYATCSFESAVYRAETSPWCFIFTEKEMEALEFIGDLKHYWADGYGFDINFHQACPLLKDMLTFISSTEGPSSTFYFTHSGTVLKFLSHLGLYYDEEKLTHKTSNLPRLWKLGHIDAFASNLAFISYQCKDEEKVLVLHQERHVRLPGCPKEGLCSLKKIMKTYKQSFYNCHFDEICQN